MLDLWWGSMAEFLSAKNFQALLHWTSFGDPSGQTLGLLALKQLSAEREDGGRRHKRRPCPSQQTSTEKGRIEIAKEETGPGRSGQVAGGRQSAGE
jgi:hypothetical protein